MIYTERELALAQQAAFDKGARKAYETGGYSCHWAAQEYPPPKKTRRRVIVGAAGIRYRVGPGKTIEEQSVRTGAWVTTTLVYPEDIMALYNLMQCPTEEVDG